MGEKSGLPGRAGAAVFILGSQPRTVVNRGSGHFVFVECISRV